MSSLKEFPAPIRPGTHRYALLLTAITAHLGILTGLAISAEISIHKNGAKTEVIFTGDVVSGDYERFVKATRKYDEADVVFSSYGGRLADGLQIAEYINLKRFKTIVRNGNTCASACGIMWLSGRQRSIEGEAQVGFHSAAESNHSEVKLPEGNLYVGMLLKKLGFSEMVVAYAVEAAPQQMRWLTPNDARFLAIDVTWISPEDTEGHHTNRALPTPTPPLPLLEAPTLLRNEVEAALLKQRFMPLMRKSYPEVYKLILDGVARSQSSGSNWTRAMFDMYTTMKFPDQLDRKIRAAFTTVHTGEFVNLFIVEVIAAGGKKSKSFCKQTINNEVVFDEQFNDVIRYGPESFRSDLIDLYSRALETALTRKNLNTAKATKKEKRRVEREISKIVVRFVGSLSKGDRKKFYKSKDIFDTSLGCPALVYMYRELKKKPEILRSLFFET